MRAHQRKSFWFGSPSAKKEIKNRVNKDIICVLHQAHFPLAILSSINSATDHLLRKKSHNINDKIQQWKITVDYLFNAPLLINAQFLINSHCSKSSFFVQKFNFDFPRKLSILLGWKTRENVVVLDFLAVDNFDFTRKIVKKNLGEKLVKKLEFCQNWIFGQKIWLFE